jgi:hypothetical protein
MHSQHSAARPIGPPATCPRPPHPPIPAPTTPPLPILQSPLPPPSPPLACQALRRKLAARRRFVPWGSSRPFVPLSTPRPPSQEAAQPEPPGLPAPPPPRQPSEEELPPGIEPLILWEPGQGPGTSGPAEGSAAEGSAGAGAPAVAAGAVVPAAGSGDGGDDGAIEVDRMLTRWLRPHQREGVAVSATGVRGSWEKPGARRWAGRLVRAAGGF